MAAGRERDAKRTADVRKNNKFGGMNVGKIIAFANQKGGVGKTTTAVNIASALGQMGKRTLLVDADPQGNATSAVGIAKKNLRFSLYTLLAGASGAEETVRETGFDNLFVIPSNIELAACELELSALDKRESRLKSALEPLKAAYDYIIIDCPPSLGMITLNALVASDGVVIPMQCEYFALEGLSQLTGTVSRVQKLYNPSLELTGILITMYNGRLNLSLQVLREIKRYYASKLFATPVQRNVRLSEAPSFGKPIGYFDRHSVGCKCYEEIAKELTERL